MEVKNSVEVRERPEKVHPVRAQQPLRAPSSPAASDRSTMVLSLTCAVQNYDWGIKGTSEVSALGELNTGVASDPTKPYAEL